MQPRDWFLPTLGENLVMSEFLTSSERASLRSAHSIERDRKVGDRMKVILLADQGESLAMIAKFLLIDEQTARRHLKDYFDNDKLGGSSGGSQGKLCPAQTEKLKVLLAAGDVPTAKAAVEKVKSLFGIKFSISGMTDWLKRSRFSFKKSQPEPAKANPQAQAEFIDTYRTLRDGLPEGEAVFFLDAAHPTMATKLGYSWSIKGERKIVATTAGKKRVNVIGTLNAKTLKLVTTFPETVNSQTPYSPNLNLIERAWKVMNEKVRDNVYFPDAQTFTCAIKNFFQHDWHKLSRSLSSRFTDNFQTFQNPAF